MSDRLTDEQVAWWAQRESISGTSISSVLAREVQEWRAMRCDTCEEQGTNEIRNGMTIPNWCWRLEMTTLPDWFCADHTPKEEAKP